MDTLDNLPEYLKLHRPIFDHFGIKTCARILTLDDQDLRWMDLYHYVNFLIVTEQTTKYMTIFLLQDILSVSDLKAKSKEELVQMGIREFHARKLKFWGNRVKDSIYEDVKAFQLVRNIAIKSKLKMSVGANFVMAK